MKINIIILCVLLLLSGCSTQLNDYKATEPKFVLEDYFNGDVIAWGMVQDYQHKKTRHFCVEIDAKWEDKQGRYIGEVDEQFYFDDGEQSQRLWRIERTIIDGVSHYTGGAADVNGVAQGQSKGSVFHWVYTLEIPIGESGDKKEMAFLVDDWIYQIDSRHAFNHSTLEKFGMTVGYLTLFFEKRDAAASCSEVSTRY